jgi:hypothetical protein
VLRTILESMEDRTTRAARPTTPGARVGAAKGRLQAARELANALALVGLLPDATQVLLARAQAGRSRSELRELVRP